MNLPPFQLERYFAAHEFRTEFLLSSSDCEAMSVADLLAYEPGAEEAFRNHWLGYTEAQGDPALREHIAAIYDAITAEQVVVHCGAEEGIFAFMHAMLSPGDQIIVHTPCYQSLAEVARAQGAEVVAWRANPEDGWALDPDWLASAIRQNTKAIVLNCPHNPTGYIMDRERFDAVIEIARRHGIYVFSDEVYRELEHDPRDRLPAACDRYERAVSLGVLSKTYGLPGLRLGWIATRDAQIRTRVWEVKDYLSICHAAPSEFLGRIALAHRTELAARNLGIVLANLQVLDEFFARHDDRFAWSRPKAGPIAFPALLQGHAEAFCHQARERARVLLVPSTIYNAGDQHIRIGFGRKNLPQAVAALEQIL